MKRLSERLERELFAAHEGTPDLATPFRERDKTTTARRGCRRIRSRSGSGMPNQNC